MYRSDVYKRICQISTEVDFTTGLCHIFHTGRLVDFTCLLEYLSGMIAVTLPWTHEPCDKTIELWSPLLPYCAY